MTGDVLPCFDASLLHLSPDEATVVTTHAPLDVASRHGVILPARQPNSRHLPGGDAETTRLPAAPSALVPSSQDSSAPAAPVSTDSAAGAAGDPSVPVNVNVDVDVGVDDASSRCASEAQEVADLLQKPSAREMEAAGAVQGRGTALLDTGMYAVCGRAWRDLIRLSTRAEEMVAELLESGEEVSRGRGGVEMGAGVTPLYSRCSELIKPKTCIFASA